MTCATRCAACRSRQSLAQIPALYLRAPRCRQCGRRGTLRVDQWRMAHERRQKPCDCSGYSFPHRPRSGWCLYSPNADLESRESYS